MSELQFTELNGDIRGRSDSLTFIFLMISFIEGRDSFQTFQELLFNLTTDSVQSTVENIVNSEIWNIEDGKEYLISNILNAIKYRDLNLSALIIVVTSLNNSFYDLIQRLWIKMTTPLFYQCYFDIDTSTIHFIDLCLKLNVFTEDMLMNFLKSMFENITKSRKCFFWMLCLFSDIIQTKDKEFFEKSNEILQKNIRDNIIPEQFQNYITKDFIVPIDQLREAIRNDNVDVLRDIAASPDFDFNMHIPILLDEVSWFVQCEPTLIQYSAYFSATKCFIFLKSAGSRFQGYDMKMKTVDHYAVAGGSLEIIRILQQNGDDFDKCLHIATIFHRFDIFMWLVEEAKLNIFEEYENQNTLLHTAAKSNNIDVIQFCLEKGFDPNQINEEGITPLILAAESNSIEAMYYLLKRNEINVNLKAGQITPKYADCTALHCAAIKGHTPIIRLLLQRPEIDVNAKDYDGDTPLHLASESSPIESIKCLLENPNTDVAAVNNKGWIPFHLAVRRNDNDIVKLFLNHGGFDLNAPNSYGGTAFIWSVISCATNTIQLLLELPEININQADLNGNTALHYAANNMKNKEPLRLLLKFPSIDVNCQNRIKFTPLMFAISSDDFESVRMFLQREDLDISIKNYKGETAYLMSQRSVSKEIRDIMAKYSPPGIGCNVY